MRKENYLILADPADVRKALKEIMAEARDQHEGEKEQPDMLTMQELCERFGKTKPTMYRFLKKHGVRRHYILRTPYVKLSDFLAAMEEDSTEK